MDHVEVNERLTVERRGALGEVSSMASLGMNGAIGLCGASGCQPASWFILRIWLSNIPAGRNGRMRERPAGGPAGLRSFGFGSVAAATMTLATTAGSSPALIAFSIMRLKAS